MEGIIMLKDCFAKVKGYNEDLCKYVPRSLNMEPDTPEAIETGKEINEFYFGKKVFDKSTEKEMSELMTDFHFAIEHYINAELLAKYQHKHVFKKLRKF